MVRLKEIKKFWGTTLHFLWRILLAYILPIPVAYLLGPYVGDVWATVSVPIVFGLGLGWALWTGIKYL